MEIAPPSRSKSIRKKRKMPRSQPSPGGAAARAAPLAERLARECRPRPEEERPGHPPRPSWSLERPRGAPFDEAEGRALGEDSDSDLNTLPTPARKQRSPRAACGASCATRPTSSRAATRPRSATSAASAASSRSPCARAAAGTGRQGRARDPGDAAAPCLADLAGPALRAAMRAVRAAGWWSLRRRRRRDFIKAAFCGCNHDAGRAYRFAACDASMKAADRLETTYKVQEEDEDEDVIKEAPLTLVKEGTSTSLGTWAPGRGRTSPCARPPI